MKIRTKLKILIAFCTLFPVLLIVFILTDSPVFHYRDFQEALTLGTVAAIIITLSGHLFGMHWLLTGQLKKININCSKIIKGDYTPIVLPSEPPDSDDENEIIALMRHMNWMSNQIKNREIRLKKTVESLEISNSELEYANNKIEEARSALWGEMLLARKIQTALLPSKPVIQGFEIAANLDPVNEVGGDYYDITSIDGHHWIIIGDVSGHGVSAGLIMMMAQTSVHTVLNENPGILPSQLLNSVNKTLTKNISLLDEYKYMTMTALHLDKNGSISFAGLHQDIMVFRASTGKVEEIETSGIWLGIMDDISDIQQIKCFKLNQGDCLLLFTDGITESKNKNGCLFGNEKLLDIFKLYGACPVSLICEKILESLKSYEHSDDRTLIILRRSYE